MRIALFSGNYNYLREGANQALNQLVEYLEEQAGHVVRVYSPVTRTPDFEPRGTLVPVSSIRLPMRGEFRLALGLPRAIREDLTQFAPDLIHVATPDILCTRAQTYGIRRGVPVVASLHTHFQAYLAYYGLNWARPLLEAHLRRFYRRSSHVLAPTAGIVSDLWRLRGDDRASLWSRGVDGSLFRPDRRDHEWRRSVGIADHEIAVLFFGRLVLEKGVAIYADVLSELQRMERPVRPLLVGYGPARDGFRGLAGAVATGHLQGIDLARAIASADLMLTPSTTETFGNVVLEAMSSGVAVVSADAPSARALIEHGGNGFLCEPTDISDYVAAADRLIASAELRARFGRAGVAASQAYTWKAASASVESAYREVLRRRSGGIGRADTSEAGLATIR